MATPTDSVVGRLNALRDQQINFSRTASSPFLRESHKAHARGLGEAVAELQKLEAALLADLAASDARLEQMDWSAGGDLQAKDCRVAGLGAALHLLTGRAS